MQILAAIATYLADGPSLCGAHELIKKRRKIMFHELLHGGPYAFSLLSPYPTNNQERSERRQVGGCRVSTGIVIKVIKYSITSKHIF